MTTTRAFPVIGAVIFAAIFTVGAGSAAFADPAAEKPAAADKPGGTVSDADAQKFVIFIFATTEPHKIPMTILSRCQRFDFKRIPLKEIIQRLKWIMEQ